VLHTQSFIKSRRRYVTLANGRVVSWYKYNCLWQDCWWTSGTRDMSLSTCLPYLQFSLSLSLNVCSILIYQLRTLCNSRNWQLGWIIYFYSLKEITVARTEPCVCETESLELPQDW
jgi:hypothetical protein